MNSRTNENRKQIIQNVHKEKDYLKKINENNILELDSITKLMNDNNIIKEKELKELNEKENYYKEQYNKLKTEYNNKHNNYELLIKEKMIYRQH